MHHTWHAMSFQAGRALPVPNLCCRQPAIVDIQILRVGQLVILCVPGEFTTMAGRRIKAAIRDQVRPLFCRLKSGRLLCIYLLANPQACTLTLHQLGSRPGTSVDLREPQPEQLMHIWTKHHRPLEARYGRPQ